MPGREEGAGAAEAGGDLVEDQQHVVGVARLAQHPQQGGEWKRIPPAPCTTGSTTTAASSWACRSTVSHRWAVYASEGGVSKPSGGASAKTCRGSTPDHRSCMPPSGSQTDMGCQVSPW